MEVCCTLSLPLLLVLLLLKFKFKIAFAILNSVSLSCIPLVYNIQLFNPSELLEHPGRSKQRRR